MVNIGREGLRSRRLQVQILSGILLHSRERCESSGERADSSLSYPHALSKYESAHARTPPIKVTAATDGIHCPNRLSSGRRAFTQTERHPTGLDLGFDDR